MPIAFKERYLIFGGTGSLGTILTKRLLLKHAHIGIFSRDESKHFKHKIEFDNHNSIEYFVGDVRNYNAVYRAITIFRPDYVICAAAMKQVPLCEEFPMEAIQTNIMGTYNIAEAINAYVNMHDIKVKTLAISTDKSVKSVNAYGATKALQEKLHMSYGSSRLNANCVRYGNVLESTGSVIPFFKALLRKSERLPVTDMRMTRFLLSLDEAVDLIFIAMETDCTGHVFVPSIKSARIIDLAEVLCEAEGKNPGTYVYETNGRPGEKLHELLISEEECCRVRGVDNHYEIGPNTIGSCSTIVPTEHLFSSGFAANLLKKDELRSFLQEKGVISCKQWESPAHMVS